MEVDHLFVVLKPLPFLSDFGHSTFKRVKLACVVPHFVELGVAQLFFLQKKLDDKITACHYYESSKCAHVSINEVACERTTGERRSAHPISVLEIRENKAVLGGLSLARADGLVEEEFQKWRR